jgi:acetyl esterase/lipase
MAYAVDPEVDVAMTAMAEALGEVEAPARDDVKALRDNGDKTLTYLSGLVPPSPNVRTTHFLTTADDGAAISLRWYTRNDESPGSAVVYAHGGGMILGSVDHYHTWVAWYVEQTGIPFLAVEYRLAPEVAGTTPMTDTFAGLRWLIDNASAHGVDPARIAIMGDSAGGGIAAGVASLARERTIPLAHQLLIDPMLDDQAPADAALAPFATWSSGDNYTGWHALLGDAYGTDDVSCVSAPARLTDHTGLPPAYIEVGELDLFRDEDIAYARALSRAEIQVEFHLHPGGPHGYDRMAPTSDLARRVFADRIRVLRSI